MTDSQQYGPNPDHPFPMPDDHKMCFLKTYIKNPNIIVGDYTYYYDFISPENFEKNVLYHFPFIGDQLIIGKFCSIASDVQFIMNGGNHRTDWITNYPFPIFGEGWEVAMPEIWPDKGNLMIGNDVWIGYNATLMPGVKVGDGAIIGAKAVVTKDVAPYAVVAGNPAKLIRYRFAPDVIERLLKIQWWHWDRERITANVQVICSGDVEALELIAQQQLSEEVA